MKSYKNSVSIAKYDETSNSLVKAIELCDSFKELKTTDKVLIKPNIVWGGGASKSLPKYGFITTSRIVEDIVQLLHKIGCTDISLGEGTIVDNEFGSNTSKGFKWSGMNRVAKKYGVKLIDFNKSSYREVDLEGSKISIADSALEADFLINLPALKTHFQTKVSLGLKNLKGCLSMSSKRKFHKKDLYRMIALLNTKVIPKLTIIDGIYALEHGPSTGGNAHRMNIVIAGRDSLSCDIVGSTILGIEPTSVEVLKEFASLTDRTLDMSSIEVKGENIGGVSKKLDWEFAFEDIFRRAGINGISFPFPGTCYCTQCVTHTEGVLLAFSKDNEKMSFDDVEICVGRDVKPKKNFKKAFLIGDCSLIANKRLEGAIRIKGCPPKATDILTALSYNTLNKGRATRIMAERVLKTFGYKLGLYNEEYPVLPNYAPPEFDENHFA